MIAARALAATAAISLAGCSALTFERLDSPARPDAMPVCSGSAWATVGDLTGAASAGVMMAFAQFVLRGDDSTANDFDQGGMMLTTYTPIAIGFLLSAGYGFRERGRCRAARDAHDAWLRARATPAPGSSP